jgi:ATPase subunit of ABC transporter with duplicated ATPase domains
VHLVGIENCSHEFPQRTIFESLTIALHSGDRIGIVGRNGDGKSTLLRILSGALVPDSGNVIRRSGLRLGMLDQTDNFDDTLTVISAVVGDGPEHEWASDPKVRDVLKGLLADLDHQALIGSLSGGQRRRVGLARLLVGDWDVILLDEPTNHLDVTGVAWLAQHINSRWQSGQGGLAVVTHDRWFLDAISTETWEVHDGIIDRYEGGYAAYTLQRLERQRQASTMEERRQNLLRKELAWLRRGAPARTSKPKFRIEAANALIENVPAPRDSVELGRMATQRLGKDVVDLLDVSVSFDGTPILRDIEWRLAPGERTGILGANGAGKSTLMGLIDGRVQPTEGRVKTGKTVVVRRLDQRLEGLDDIMDDRVSAVIARYRTEYSVGGATLSPGQLLERLGFQTAQLSTEVRNLSGGQKRRLQFLLILLDEPNVLLLDEPTNDLDIDMLAAMEDVLDTWPGTLIVVSHDRYLLERITDNQFAVMNGHLRHLPGGIDEYLRLEAAHTARPASSPRGGAAAPTATVASSGGAARPELSGAERRTLDKELQSLERKIAKITAEVDEVHAVMAAHDSSDYAGLTALSDRLRGIENDLETTESQWLEVVTQLEA